MRIACFFLSTLLIALASAAAFAALPRGHVVYENNFESPSPLRGWGSRATLESGYKGGHAIRFERLNGAAPATMASLPLPVEELRGHTLYCSARVRAEKVSDKPQPWNGIKFMMPIEAPSGKSWPQAKIEVGTFDWQPVRFAVTVPPDATAMALNLGLEQVTGTVWFDDLRIEVGKPPVVARPRPAGPMYKGHTLPRLRGTMISPRIDEAGLEVLGRQWNANLIRWQLIRHGARNQGPALEGYDAWLETELKKLDVALPWCEKYGLYVALDLHSPPGGVPTSGGYHGSDAALFTDKACQAKFVRIWQDMARRYKDSKVIWGFDLANEPVEDVPGEGCEDWQALAERTAKAIRQIDPDRTLIIEPANWGSPAGLLSFQPIDVPNVVYSVHMYLPGSFTHQGVHGPSKPVVYPGLIEGKQWDRAALEAALKPVVDFQKTHNVHIYIGEFSAIRWAPDNSAYRYLKDVIDVFEAHDWDWSYHAFREWSGWSVEHDENRANTKPATQPTDRQKLLCEWFGKNQKPAW